MFQILTSFILAFLWCNIYRSGWSSSCTPVPWGAESNPCLCYYWLHLRFLREWWKKIRLALGTDEVGFLFAFHSFWTRKVGWSISLFVCSQVQCWALMHKAAITAREAWNEPSSHWINHSDISVHVQFCSIYLSHAFFLVSISKSLLGT